MTAMSTDDPLALAVVVVIHAGDVAALQQLLEANPGLADARLGDDDTDGMSRTLLHVVTDWPGHFPNGAATVAALVRAGADVNARFRGPHEETPLHWAASSDDVEVLDALLDAGADIEAPGAVIRGGPPLEDARAFAQWNAAHRLVERGARTTLVDAATLGLLDRVERSVTAEPPSADDLNRSFWGACHGGQLDCAAYLLQLGAALDWLPPWENLTPLDAAHGSGGNAPDGARWSELVQWLQQRGARSANQLPRI